MYDGNVLTSELYIVSHRRNGIKYRQPEEAVGGWFTQIGEMHIVHHLWGESAEVSSVLGPSFWFGYGAEKQSYFPACALTKKA